MARNSAGVMTIPTQLVAGTPALASDVMNNFNDIGQELTDSLSRSGKGGMQSHLGMNGFRVTGLANPVEAQDAVTKSYADGQAVELAPILTSIGANFGSTPDMGVYASAENVAAEFALTAAGRALAGAVDAAAQRIAIGIATGLAADQGKMFYLNATGLLTLLAVGTAGQVLTSGGPAANPAWATVGGVPHVVFEGQGSAGGTSTTTWQTRVLNTTVRNTGSFATLAADVITLTAGSYWVEFSAPANRVQGHQAKFEQLTPSVLDRVWGTSEATVSAACTTTHSNGAGMFTITATGTFELKHKCDVAGEPLGVGTGYGPGGTPNATNVYSRVKIWRI